MTNCLIIIFIILLLWYICLSIDNTGVLVISSFDGEEYSVKKTYHNMQKASDTLARLNKINTELISHLEKKYKNTNYKKEIEFLSGNYNGDALEEHMPSGPVNTSYVLNKGDVIKLCLRDPTSGRFHDFNTLVFVNLHELSHLLDRKWGHGDSFWDGFKFILQEAVQLNLYTPVDYSKKNTAYCGITIESNPLYEP